MSKNKQNINILLSAIISSVLFGCGSGGTSASPNSTNMATNKSDLTSKASSSTEINLCSSFPKWEESRIYDKPDQIVSYYGKLYINHWWTKGENPIEHNGIFPGSGQAWTVKESCEIQPAVVQAGLRNTFVLTSQGDIYASGKGTYGVLGNGSTNDSSTPVKVLMPVQATKVVSNETGNVACAIGNDSKVYCWGGNGTGLQGTGDTTGSVIPRVTNFPAGAKDIVITSDLTSFVLTENGDIYASGKGNYGILGNGSTNSVTTPVRVALNSDEKAIKVVKASLNDEGDDACALTDKGNVYCWGGNAHGTAGVGDTKEHDTPVQVKLSDKVTDIVLGGYSDLFMITENGDVYASGSDAWGALGDGKNNTETYVPVKVAMPAGIKTTKVVSDGYDSCALGDNHKVYCWGGNGSGFLGFGSTGQVFTPTLTNFPDHVQDITMGATQDFKDSKVVVALTTSGTLFVSGTANYGALGLGRNYTKAYNPTSITLSDETNVPFTSLNIVSNGMTSCSIGTSGSVYCWGANGNGVMGNGGTSTLWTPAKTQFVAF